LSYSYVQLTKNIADDACHADLAALKAVIF